MSQAAKASTLSRARFHAENEDFADTSALLSERFPSVRSATDATAALLARMRSKPSDGDAAPAFAAAPKCGPTPVAARALVEA